MIKILMNVVTTLLIIPFSVQAIDEIIIGTVTISGTIVSIPLEIVNQDSLIAIDIALKYSDGIEFKTANFEGSRVEYFDLNTSAQLPKVENTIFVCCVWQLSSEPQPVLAAGTGLIATLIFEATSPNAKIVIEPTKTVNPYHSPKFIYGVGKRQQEVHPSVRVSSSEAINIPKHLELLQNYPNPFNPTTTIRFNLPVYTYVKLTVYNILGQYVETLISESLPAGPHTINWNATSVASGTYFYRIDTKDLSVTKKMMMLK